MNLRKIEKSKITFSFKAYQAIKTNRKIHLCFIDTEKAFERIKRMYGES